MNERINELFEKAGANANTVAVLKQHTYFDPELFAELIVKECAGIVQTYMSRWPEDAELTKQIKKHFGVEE